MLDRSDGLENFICILIILYWETSNKLNDIEMILYIIGILSDNNVIYWRSENFLELAFETNEKRIVGLKNYTSSQVVYYSIFTETVKLLSGCYGDRSIVYWFSCMYKIDLIRNFSLI